MSANPIRIVVADDHLVTRLGIVAMLSAHKDISVVGEAANGLQLISLFRQHRPDVAVTDMLMPVMSGYEAVTAIRKDYSNARFVALSTYGGGEDIRRAVQAGVQAYLTKDVLDDEVVKAIRTVHQGGRYFAGTVSAALQAQEAQTGLSSREREVLELIVPGLSNKQIAVALNIAEYTVKNHVRSILSKLDADDRTQAAVIAIQRGLVRMEH
jgi:two-component system NarL family response regulator